MVFEKIRRAGMHVLLAGAIATLLQACAPSVTRPTIDRNAGMATTKLGQTVPAAVAAYADCKGKYFGSKFGADSATKCEYLRPEGMDWSNAAVTSEGRVVDPRYLAPSTSR